MTSYFLKRLLLAIPTLVGVVTVVFFSIRLVPGNPIQMMIPQGLPSNAEKQIVQRIETEYGFNKPLYVQYADYMGSVAHFKFGRSLISNREILPDLQGHALNTLQLGIIALLISVVLGVPAGIVSAARRDSLLDNTVMVGALLGVSIPSFVLGYVLILVFGLDLGMLPPSGFGGSILTWQGFTYVIMPAVALGSGGAGVLARFTRSSVLEVIREDFIRTARAKGLAERRVLYRHVLRNVLIPVITVFGIQFGAVLSGAVVIETVFGWPGIGRYMIDAIRARDFPVVQATVIVIALGFVIGNLLTDLAYSLIDPRIRYD